MTLTVYLYTTHIANTHHEHDTSMSFIHAHPKAFLERDRTTIYKAEAGIPRDKRCHSPPPCQQRVPPNEHVSLARENPQSFMRLLEFLADYILDGWLLVHLPTITLPTAAQEEEPGALPWPGSFWVPLLTPSPSLMDSNGGPFWHRDFLVCQMGERETSAFILCQQSSKRTGL